MEFSSLKKYEEVLGIVKKFTVKPEPETVKITEALGRVCFSDVHSEIDVPSFERSAMDGYAARAKDISGASLTNPISLKVVERVDAKTSSRKRVEENQCIEVATGSEMPEGADCVVMREYAREMEDSAVLVYSSLPAQKNISPAGEDIKAGELILGYGKKINVFDVGMLAAAGHSEVKVVKKPMVGLIVSGTELTPPGTKAKKPTYDCNTYTLSAWLKQIGCDVINYGIVIDDEQVIRNEIKTAVGECESVIITGGSSVGRSDYTTRNISQLGELLVHGVAIRPGKPFAMGTIKGKVVFDLPGFPVSALVSFYAFCKPFYERMLGLEEQADRVKAILTAKVASRVGTRDYMRVQVRKKDNEYYADPLRLAGGGVLSSLSKCNGFLIIPEDVEGYENRETVEIELIKFS